ncbi:hypothetical protein CU669_03795 [Paramagnetospirillum kuznetsovii]|uniref:Uncharacterized protein n=1 Tax=Paramagnetospirillum kuznetsovii TaxID=2053833 RepID=A0A364P1Q7_9PROT|nr:tetratricopeptide repeat protein [Paramagnetospirillum kuznetsovii]RAU23279.1 hypothetical protein CU669_03795 [Paramagnetospirillum kuznetsovii]
MDRFNPEVLWREMLAEGRDGLTDDEAVRLLDWVDGREIVDGDPLTPKSEAQAIQASGFAAQLVSDDRLDTALTIFRLAIAAFERFSKPRSTDRLDALRSFATALLRADRLDEAETAVARLGALAAGLKSGRDGWDAIILYHRAAIADRRGHQAEAPDLLRRALELAEGAFGPVGGWTDIIRGALANSLAFLGQDAELTDLCRRAALLLHDDAEAARPWLTRLAELLSAQGGSSELVGVQLRLAETSAALLGPLAQFEDLMALGRSLVESGRAEDALEPLGRAVVLAEAQVGESGVDEPGLLASARFWMAEAMAQSPDGDPELIHELYGDAIAGFTDAAGPDDDATLYARHALGRFLRQIGLLEDAEAEIAAACAAAEAAASPMAGALAETLTQLRKRRLATREKGRLFGWALAQSREIHAEDRLSLALAAMRMVAENVEAEQVRHQLWAETAVLLASVGHEDQAMAILGGVLGTPAAGVARARVQSLLAMERLRRGETETAAEMIALACAQAAPDGDAALADLVDALALAGGREALALAEPALPPSLLPRLRDAMLAERVASGDLDGALALYEAGGGASLGPRILRDLATQAAKAGRSDEAVALARRLADTSLDGEAVEILLQVDAEAEAMAAVGALESGLPFIDGVALTARHFAAKGDRAIFARRAGEAFTHMGAHPLDAADLAVPLRHIAEGALDLMGKDQALVWAAGQLPDTLVGGFAQAMGRALEEKRGIGGDGAALEAGIALEHGKELMALGRWDDAIAALVALTDPAVVVGACIHVAETAAAVGDLDAAARALKTAFGRLSGADAQCGRRLGEAVAGLLPSGWRGAFCDAALTKAAGMDDLMVAACHVVAAAHASIGAD